MTTSTTDAIAVLRIEIEYILTCPRQIGPI